MTNVRKSPSGEELDVLATPSGTATPGNVVRADDSGEPLWSQEFSGQAMFTPHGWVDRADTTVTVTGATRTLSLAPVGASAAFWRGGYPRTFTAAQSVVWPNVEGIHFFYLDADGVLQTTQNIAIWDAAILGTGGTTVWALYWSTTNALPIRSLEERHGATMDGRTHYHMHRGIGTRRYSGGLLQGFTIGAGNDDADAVFGAGPVTIADEDLEFSYTSGVPQVLTPILQAPVFYLIGTDWRRKPVDDYPVIQAGSVAGALGTRLSYNQITGGSGALTEVTNNDFVLCHVFVSTDASEPFMAVAGQNSYTNLNNAREGATTELLTLRGLLALLSTDFTPLGTVIYQTSGGYGNTVLARVVLTDLGNDYVDMREGPK